ncbi:MAG TPA: phage head closure protein [Alphaproteobacteria bacterium]|nr:phage head closure protein [Alphaproteobacteria bacterium]
MRGVNPGKYRHRIQIQEAVDAQDPTTGVITRTWATVSLDSDTPLDSVPARALTGQGRETHAAGTKLAETEARFEFRWFAGLTEAMRIVWDGRVYDILSIDTDETARREYRVRCKGGLTDGS